jgi:hypothetical protein
MKEAGADVLDWSADADHHRSVVTLVGSPEVVEAAAFAAARVAVARIDLRRHSGVHPRVGALDVLPFVPLAGLTLADARASARRVGRALAMELGVPVYFYGQASEPPGRTLAMLRRGGFETLASGLADGPDGPTSCRRAGRTAGRTRRPAHVRRRAAAAAGVERVRRRHRRRDGRAHRRFTARGERRLHRTAGAVAAAALERSAADLDEPREPRGDDAHGCVPPTGDAGTGAGWHGRGNGDHRHGARPSCSGGRPRIGSGWRRIRQTALLSKRLLQVMTGKADA